MSSCKRQLRNTLNKSFVRFQQLNRNEALVFRDKLAR